MRRHLIPALLVAVAAATPALAAGPSAGPSWATVNVCDPGTNEVGVRAGFPDDGSHARTLARFTVEWLDPKVNVWKQVDGVPTSPWIATGSALQVGWTFRFDPPPAGTTFQIRGVAELQWRRGGSVVRSETRVASAGAPVGFGGSQATCSLS